MRRHRIFRSLGLFIVVTAIAATLAATASGSAFPNRFGMRFLEFGACCSNNTLNGTMSNIIVNSASPGSAHCDLFRSDAEDDSAGYLIQVGAVKCGSTSGGLDATCSLSNNLVKFVEYLTPGNPYKCIAEGGLSTGANLNYLLDNNPNTCTWTAEINYSPLKSLCEVSNMEYLVEGGEHTGTDDCSGWSGSGTWASGPDNSYRWQRYYASTLSWIVVQGASTSSGCWTLSGGPPGSFTISH